LADLDTSIKELIIVTPAQNAKRKTGGTKLEKQAAYKRTHFSPKFRKPK